MTRSKKKLPYIDARLLEKIKKTIEKAKEASKGGAIIVPPIKTYSRRSTIVDIMIGLEIQVYNGNKFIPVKVFDNLLGHKLGEFSPTRTFRGHPESKKDTSKGKKK